MVLGCGLNLEYQKAEYKYFSHRHHAVRRSASQCLHGSSRALQLSDIDSPCRFSVWRGRRLATGAPFLLEFRLFLASYLRYGRRTQILLLGTRKSLSFQCRIRKSLLLRFGGLNGEFGLIAYSLN